RGVMEAPSEGAARAHPHRGAAWPRDRTAMPPSRARTSRGRDAAYPPRAPYRDDAGGTVGTLGHGVRRRSLGDARATDVEGVLPTPARPALRLAGIRPP